MDYQKEFINIMYGPSYWLAHTALQAIFQSKSSFLVEAYEWMWKKYKDDSIMRSNLQIAFESNGINRN